MLTVTAVVPVRVKLPPTDTRSLFDPVVLLRSSLTVAPFRVRSLANVAVRGEPTPPTSSVPATVTVPRTSAAAAPVRPAVSVRPDPNVYPPATAVRSRTPPDATVTWRLVVGRMPVLPIARVPAFTRVFPEY